MWMQKQPGYVGNSVANCGEIDLGELRTVRELQESFEEWWVRVYQNRPHRELRDRDVPSRMFTPNQMHAVLFDAGAGIPIPLDQGTYIPLTPVGMLTEYPVARKMRSIVSRVPSTYILAFQPIDVRLYPKPSVGQIVGDLVVGDAMVDPTGSVGMGRPSRL